jgi:hypothetical protein
MNLSSPAPPLSPGYVSEPPLTPGPAAPQRAQSLEAQVVRMGLMTPDDVATTMREEAETGRSFAELAVEHGRISAEDMARLTGGEQPVEAAPAPAPTLPPTPPPAPAPVQPAPVAASEPAMAPPPGPTPVGQQVTAEVFVRLTSGERIRVGAFDGQSAAEQCARELMAALDSDGDWPQIEGRYIRPDAVVSIDVDLTAA